MYFYYALEPTKPLINKQCSIVIYTGRELKTKVPISICGIPKAKFMAVPLNSKYSIGSSLENGSFVPDVVGYYKIEVESEYNVNYITPKFKGDLKSGRTSSVFSTILECNCLDLLTIPVKYGEYDFNLNLEIDDSYIKSVSFDYDSSNEKLKNILNGTTVKWALNEYCLNTTVSSFIPSDLYLTANELTVNFNNHIKFGDPHYYREDYFGGDQNENHHARILNNQTPNGLIVALNELRNLFNLHGLFKGHKVTSSKLLSAVPSCSDLSSAMILLMNLQIVFSNHLDDLTVHSETDNDYKLSLSKYLMFDLFRFIFSQFDLDQTTALSNNNSTTSLLINRGFGRKE